MKMVPLDKAETRKRHKQVKFLYFNPDRDNKYQIETIGSFALCAVDLQDFAVGDRGGHVCSTLQDEDGGGEEGDDEQSIAGSACERQRS